MIIKRVGGKAKIANWIVKHLPQGETFVDVFGGSGVVLDAVAKAKASRTRLVYNDLDSKLYVFFSILQSRPLELAHLTALTPYSRKFHDDSFRVFKSKEQFEALCDLDKALVFLIVNRQCFGSKMDGTWSITRDGEINYETWNKMPRYVVSVAKRWKSVFLENLDYELLVKKWDSKNAVFYADPPYEGVEENYYEVNKDEGFDHGRLLNVLAKVKGAFCVSYYGGDEKSGDTDLIRAYRDLGCSVIRKEVSKHLSMTDEKQKVTEVLLVKGCKTGPRMPYDD